MTLPLGATQVAVVSFITMAFAIVATLLRIWSRRLQNLPLGFHDYMAIVAMFLAAATVSVFLTAGFAAGLGMHLTDIMETDPSKICVLSLLRVHWLAAWDLTDLTYTETPGAIYSVLEPTLGVVNACLPTIKPAINKILGLDALNCSQRDPESNKSSNKTPVQNRRWTYGASVKGNGKRDFERLEDEFPLTSLRTEGHPGTKFCNGNNLTVNEEFRLHTSTQGMVWVETRVPISQTRHELGG
ncbi:hypothetical protein INS49_009578 [Diaporthe citri]|uniref:uncharacterized protein n=1 Tax=Diaporthe citri TaxID=83186 RepID=UPI001C7E4197|nr:uncharacterized protein INS49_009578 [Diaporthe citri]KAG6361353.1 hypothetical protein INS49_009578 [Diaporthe citri]